MRDLYQAVILDHGRNPRHQRRLEPFDGAAKGDNPMCGDRVEVRVRVADGRMAEAGFEARGCAISVASADLMAEAVAGPAPARCGTWPTGSAPWCDRRVPRLCRRWPAAPLAGVHEFKSRLKCATLPWDALLAALKDTDHG